MQTFRQYQYALAGAIGSGIEFFDFVIFLMLSNVLAKVFFPDIPSTAQYLSLFSVFALGHIPRPIGGLIFSHLGDRIGRKRIFLSTMFGMGIPTILIGCIPAYNHAGILATILFVLLRIIQGLALGGELPGSLVYVVETAPKRRRAQCCAIIYVGITIGIASGSFLSGMLQQHLNHTAMYSWGWRVPFILGGTLAWLSYFVRSRLRESKVFLQTPQLDHRPPVSIVLQNHPLQVLQGFVLTTLGAVTVSLNLWVPTYLHQYFQFPIEKTSAGISYVTLFSAVLALIFGRLSDYFGRKSLTIISCVSLATLGYSCFAMMGHSMLSFYIGITALTVLTAGFAASYTAQITELFPTGVRFTGFAVSYNISYAIFGGTTPLIAEMLIKWTGYKTAPGVYLAVIAVICLLSAVTLPANSHKTVLSS